MKFFNTKICCGCDELVVITEVACPSCMDTAFFPLVSIIEPLEAEVEIIEFMGEQWRFKRI